MRESLPDRWYINTTEVPEAGIWFNKQVNTVTGTYTRGTFEYISSHNDDNIKIGTTKNPQLTFSGIREHSEKITREEFLHFILGKSIDNEPLFLN